MPLFKKPIEQEFFNLRLRAGRPMTELEFYAKELTDWETSPERREMIDGDRYYTGDHDILKRQRTAIGPDGKLIVIENLPNNRIVDNQYAKHVDQKANYLLGQPISFSCENDDYAAEVKKVLGMRFMRTLKSAGVECLNAGISWLYPYYNKNGELAFRVFPGYEIMPFWADAAHTELDSALRLTRSRSTMVPRRKSLRRSTSSRWKVLRPTSSRTAYSRRTPRSRPMLR